MSVMRLIIFSVFIISGSKASGVGHVVPAVKSHAIVRYAPFYNFPGTVRSIHAVAPAPIFSAPLPAPVLPAPLPLPISPAPFPGRVLPTPIFPGPAIAPALPAPVPFLPGPIPAPVLPAPPVVREFTPAFGPAIAPFAAPAYASAFTSAVAPIGQYLSTDLPKFAPPVPAFPAPLFPRPVAELPATPFAPILRPAPSVLPGIAPAYPSPLFAPAPAPIAVARPFPYSISQYAPLAPIVKEVAWK